MASSCSTSTAPRDISAGTLGEHSGRARRRVLDPAGRAEMALDPFAHHRLRHRPHVELRIERARHALDHHHGLLQQQQLRPRAHVEQAGDLEQQHQQLRHRDFVGGAVVDRLADGADRLREALDRMVRRHVAGLEMHLGGALVVAGDEAVEDFGEEAALLRPEPAHDAEVDRDELALVVDEQIARMHVGVEEAVAQRVAQEGLDHRARQMRKVEARGLELRAVGAAACRRSIPASARPWRCGPSRPSARGSPDRPWCSPPSRTAPRLPAAGPSRSRPSGASVATVSIRRSRRASADRSSARRAAKVKASRSTRKRRSMSGRSTLTATGLRRRPRLRPMTSARCTSARCTCAIEAAATAGPKRAKISVERLAERVGDRALRPRPAGTAPSCPAGFRDRARALRRPRPAASPGTGRA